MTVSQPSQPSQLSQLNQLDEAAAQNAFWQCCTAKRWVDKMVAARPYRDESALFEHANSSWQGLAEVDYLEAFDGHPKIGDVASLREKYSATKQLASGEQSGVNSASEQALTQLKQLNDEYLTKYGFIFIVCATGKSAQQMLLLLQQRLVNRREQEIINASAEQAKIFHIRLHKMLGKTVNKTVSKTVSKTVGKTGSKTR